MPNIHWVYSPEIAFLAAFVPIIVLLVVLFRNLKRTMQEMNALLIGRIDGIDKAQERIAQGVRDEVARHREESVRMSREHRQELGDALKSFGDALLQRMTEIAVLQRGQLESFAMQLNEWSRISAAKLDGIRTESTASAKQLREEIVSTLKGITEAAAKTMGELSKVQKTQLEAMSVAIGKLSESNEKRFEGLRWTVEEKLNHLRVENAKQLEQMRQTVDEKLQGTLEKRLGESFRQVSERLELVHKGLGEMQNLATGVGDLKKVLTNVKTRGTWGEVQLGMLLEQVLSPDQFAANVATKDGQERVEYAIRLPSQTDDPDDVLYLPIDAKFPIEDYQRLLDAQEAADTAGVEAAGRQLEVRVKACARDICDKYLNPPKTTDFGILFLPIEGLFAEVIRRSGLIESIQRDCRVVIAGPTTLWAILSSLQMGFRTLAIQKRSSEVWKLLAAVKTEWAKYGDVLEAVQKKLHQASETIEKAKVRNRAVGRKLRGVEALPLEEALELLPPGTIEEEE